MKKTVLVVGLLVLAACGGGKDDPVDTSTWQGDVSPVGTWAMQWTWGAGDCGYSGDLAQSVIVTQPSTGTFYVDPQDDTTTFDGTMRCTSDGCDLQGAFKQDDAQNDAHAVINVHVVLNATRDLSGNGTLTVTSPSASCSQRFDIGGKNT